MASKTAHSENSTTPEVVVTFPNIFKLKSYQGGTPSKSIRLLFDKNNKVHMDYLKSLVAQMNAVLVEQWPNADERPRIPMVGHDKSPIKDGDKSCNGQGIPYKEKNPEVVGHYFLTASKYPNESNPDAALHIVDRNKADILNAGEIYSGCYCKVNLNAYARTRTDNKGISLGLNGVQKIKDGERIGGGGGPSVDDMFEASGAADPLAYGKENDFFGSAPAGDDDVPF